MAPKLDRISTRNDAVMPSPIDSPRSASIVANPKSGISSPNVQQPGTAGTHSPKSSEDMQSLLKDFEAYTQSIVITATLSFNHDALLKTQEQQKDEHSRWSKYFDSYIALGEDQIRSSNSTEELRQRSEKMLSKAHQSREGAMRSIAKRIMAAGSGLHSSVTEQENISLKDEIATLKHSLNTVKSDVHRLNENVNKQRLRDEEVPVNRQDFVRKSVYRELEVKLEKLEKRYSDHASQIKILTNLNSNQGQLKADMADLQTRKLDSVKDDLRLELSDDIKSDIRALSNGLKQSNDNIRTERSKIVGLRLDLDNQKKEVDALRDGKAHVEKAIHDFGQVLNHTEGYQNTTEGAISNLRRDLTSHVQNSQQSLQTLQNEQKGQGTIVQLMNGRLDECSTKTSALNQELVAVRDTVQNHNFLREQHASIEGLREDLQQFKSRMAELEQRPRPTTPTSHQEGDRGTSTDTPREFSNVSSMKDLEDKVQSLLESVGQMKAEENKRDETVAQYVDELHDLLVVQKGDTEKAKSEVEAQKGSVTQLMADFASISDRLSKVESGDTNSETAIKQREEVLLSQKDLIDRFLSDVSAHSTALEKLETSLSGQGSSIHQLVSDVSALQTLSREISQAPHGRTRSPSPQANGVLKKAELIPKIETIESDLREFKALSTDKANAMEAFLATQDSRWNNLSTDNLSRSMLHQLQQLYPAHPGNIHNLQADFGTIKQRQTQVDTHMAHLIRLIHSNREEDTKRISELEERLHDARQRLDNFLADQIKTKKVLEAQISKNTKNIQQIVETIPNHREPGALDGLEKRLLQATIHHFDNRSIPPNNATVDPAFIAADQKDLHDLQNKVESISQDLEPIKAVMKNYEALKQRVAEWSDESRRVNAQVKEALIDDRSAQQKLESILLEKVKSLERDFTEKLLVQDKLARDMKRLKSSMIQTWSPQDSEPNGVETKLSELDNSGKDLANSRDQDRLGQALAGMKDNLTGVRKRYESLEFGLNALKESFRASLDSLKESFRISLDAIEAKTEKQVGDFFAAQKDTHAATQQQSKGLEELKSAQEALKTDFTEMREESIKELTRADKATATLNAAAGITNEDDEGPEPASDSDESPIGYQPRRSHHSSRSQDKPGRPKRKRQSDSEDDNYIQDRKKKSLPVPVQKPAQLVSSQESPRTKAKRGRPPKLRDSDGRS